FIDQPRLIFVAGAIGLHVREARAHSVAIDDATLGPVEIQDVRERKSRVEIAREQLAAFECFDQMTTTRRLAEQNRVSVVMTQKVIATTYRPEAPFAAIASRNAS